ncbi:MAG: tetratricopeptide repeat protein [Alphaproteobacteria bacterium]|nr:tetratricopeptide repeat protein [Alphaproteobacteria bacterium]
MIRVLLAARLTLLAALLAAAPVARAQSTDPAAEIAPALRTPVAAYRAGDLRTAETLLRALSPKDPEAEAWLGAVLLDRGQVKEALRAMQHAADAGSGEGMHRLALVHATGVPGTPRNDAKAAELFEKAAKAGHRRAQLNIGILYSRGQGVAQDLVQARAWLEKAAAGGDAYALYALARAMEDSQGPAQPDFTRAADLYRQAAEKGHPLAGLRYGLALNDGAGIKKDPVAAQRWLTFAQERGVPEAALAMGDMAARTPASRDKAANTKVVQSAVAWYQVAANAGVPSAQFKVANAYFSGVGATRDSAQALTWYARASQQGLPEAQHALGVMLIGGVAGQSDPVEGFKWLLLAEKGNHPDSRSVREKAAEKIPERDRKRAEALAQRFVPVLERPIDNSGPRLVPPSKP